MKASEQEKQLIKNCLSGDESAWKELYRRYYRLVKYIVSSPKWDFPPALHKDLIQEVFLRLVKGGLEKFQFQGTLSSYIGRITRNACVTELRKRMKACLVDLPNPDSLLSPKIDGPEHSFEKKQVGLYLARAFKKLDDRCRQFIISFYSDEMPYQDIAKRFGTTVSNVGVSLKRCLKKLRQLYCQLTGGTS